MGATFRLHSPQTGTTYSIFLHPAIDEAAGERGPLASLMVMDADFMMEAAVDACDALREAGKLPPILLVGVGYGANFDSPSNRRGRDYTPTANEMEPTSGGGTAFLHFLVETLSPELGRRHVLDPRRRGIAGHSLGSLLVLHALFQSRPFFSHHLASAPSIWWDERAILRQAAGLRAQQEGLGAKLFLSVGEDDTPSMTGDLDLLEKQLAERPFAGLETTTRRFAGHDHLSVLPDAFRAGMDDLFGSAGVSRKW